MMKLFYRIEYSTAFSYENPQPLSCDLPEFHIKIEGGQAIVEPKAHFATADEALKVVEPVLRAWKLDAALEHDGNALQFVYQHAVVIDGNLPPGSAVGFAAGRATARGMGTTVLRQYPAPPAGLVVRPDSDVEDMSKKWLQYKAGEARLADTANFCRDALEKGQPSAAEKKYGIERGRKKYGVLNTLREMAAEKGGSDARKHKGSHSPYTETERAWLEAILKKLMYGRLPLCKRVP
jgi:hypothetical protein